MAGAGNYFVKKTPTHNDDAQSGAVAGQVVTLTTGGLGAADAFIGGYVTNATQAETRAIVSHTDTTVTLEGDISGWGDTDDLDIYDAWSTIQATHDQLVTDQGSAEFTAAQTIRMYPGTFNELVALSSSLRPTAACRLIIEGTSRTESILSGAGLSGYTFDGNTVDNILFQALTVVQSASNRGVMDLGSGCVVRSATLCAGMTGANYSLQFNGLDGLAEDCRLGVCYQIAGYYRRCYFDANGTNNGVLPARPTHFELCVFDGAIINMRTGVSATSPAPVFPLSIINCVFYNMTSAIYGPSNDVRPNLILKNNSFYNVTTPISFDQVGTIESEGNCFYGHTNVASIGGTDYATLADWQAFVDEVGNSPDEHSIETDPLMTDPGNGDFSLTAASPCRHAGVGSGVTTGINDVDFDPYHPDIGAWSSGIGPNIAHDS